MKQRRTYNLGTIAIAGLYVVAAYVVPPSLFPTIAPDFLDAYHPGAIGLQRGDGYVSQSGEAITHWPPGFSILLSPIATEAPKTTLARARHLEAATAALLVLVVAVLVSVLFPGASTLFRLVAVSLTVLWPSMVAVPNPATSELFFILALTVAVICLALAEKGVAERTWHRPMLWATLCGLILGVATLVKTLGIAVIGASLIALLFAFRAPFQRRAVISIGLFSACCLPLAPWVIHVKAETGQFALSTAGIPSIQDGLGRYSHLEAGRFLDARRGSWRTGEDVRADLAAAWRHSPGSMARLVGEKSIRPWYGTDSGRLESVLMLLNLPWLFAFMVVAARTVRRWSQIPAVITGMVGIVGAVWLSSIVALSIFRYVATVFPFLVLTVMWHAHDFTARRGSE